MEYLAKKEVETLPDWPPRSPDLSPIENMWAIIQRRVDSHGPTTYKHLKQFILEEWEKIPMEVVNNLCGSFEGRLRRCLASKGMPIKTKGCTIRA